MRRRPPQVGTPPRVTSAWTTFKQRGKYDCAPLTNINLQGCPLLPSMGRRPQEKHCNASPGHSYHWGGGLIIIIGTSGFIEQIKEDSQCLRDTFDPENCIETTCWKQLKQDFSTRSTRSSTSGFVFDTKSKNWLTDVRNTKPGKDFSCPWFSTKSHKIWVCIS